MAQQKSKEQIAKEWLELSIKGWREEINRLKIGSTQELFDSFHGNIVSKASNSLEAHIAYAWYGQMVDMGVGRGTANGDQQSGAAARKLLGKGAGHDRKAKPWYTKGKKKNIGYQTHRFSELIGAAIADETVQRIADSVSLNHIIKLD